VKTSAALLLSWLLTATAAAQELPREERVPGGIAVVTLSAATGIRPKVTYLGKRVAVVNHDGRWKAVVGLPLSVQPGIQQLRVSESEQTRRIEIHVDPKSYPAQHIRLRNRRMVDLSPADLARHHRDRAVIAQAFSRWREQEDPPLRFSLPVDGPLSSRFGLRRFFNGQPRAPHSGLDIAAPAGTPIHSPADGLVVETGHFFFNGKTVFLEHGQGLISMFNHLDRIDVRPGQTVRRGERIGTVGRTGRITGPHLHWTVILNRAPVNPELFLPGQSSLSGRP